VRRPTTWSLLLGVALLSGVLAGCRPDTVELGFEPVTGATYRFQYDITLHLEQALEGEEATATDHTSTVTAAVTILASTPEGARARLVVHRDGAADQTLTVLIDRAGSLRGIDAIAELPADTIGVGDLSALLGAAAAPPPSGPVGIGDTWTFGAPGPVRGEARLDRFGVIDGEHAAWVSADLAQSVDDDIDAGPSGAHLAGDVRVEASTAYDVADGAVRRSHVSGHGDLDATILPPAGITATPARATITYDLEVTTTRLD
jgi:hypothetical protein